MKGPTSFGSLSAIDGAPDDDRMLFWSHAMNDWIAVPIAAFRDLVGPGSGLRNLYASTAGVYANNTGLFASSTLY